MQNFPVLAYHKISPQSEFGLTTLRPDIFERQINIILNAGYTPVTFESLFSGATRPEKPLILTFDDGYESIYKFVLPLLIKYRIGSVVYILAKYIGQYSTWEAFAIQRKFRHLNREQLQELHAEGIEIGSHGMEHMYYPMAAKQTQLNDLKQSKAILEDITDSAVSGFCFPYGRYSQLAREQVKKAGYQYAVGNAGFFALDNQVNDNCFFTRRSIYSSDTEQIFRQKLNYPGRFDLSHLTENIIKVGALTAILRKVIS